MHIKQDKIHDHFNRDVYWSKVYIESEDHTKKTTIFICVSEEYLMDKFGVNDLEEDKIKEWFDTVFAKYSEPEESIFKEKYHYDVYANTNEGILNGVEFLKKEFTQE